MARGPLSAAIGMQITAALVSGLSLVSIKICCEELSSPCRPQTGPVGETIRRPAARMAHGAPKRESSLMGFSDQISVTNLGSTVGCREGLK